MEILVVNDDGYDAEGIKILANALKRFGNVTLVAPSSGRSASSHSIIMKEAILFDNVFVLDGIESYSCSGMPADCVRLSTSVLHKEFDIVFSGINNGLNCGTDIIYSGTVGAAKEAIIEGIPSVAISSDYGDFTLAKNEIDGLLEYIFKNKLYSKDYVLNVNFPVKAYTKSKGYRFTKQGIKSFKTEFMKNNKGSYDVLSDKITYDLDSDTDVSLGKEGYITFVPVGIDQTNHSSLKKLREFNV